MDMTKTGGPAFPEMRHKPYPGGGGFTTYEGGMWLRDYFAAKAMQGFCANPDHEVLDGGHAFDAAASEAYRIADAMLRAREA